MKRFNLNSMLAVGLLAMGSAFSSCEKEDVAATNGKFRVAMTDAPADYVALDVQIKGVSIYHDQEGWTTLSNETQTVNVLSLQNGIESEIAAAGSVEAGHYSKLKIILGDENKLSVSNGISIGGLSTTLTFDMQYAGSREIVVEIDAEVNANQEASVLVDFDVARSVVESAGTYILSPVIREIRDTRTGLSGEVSGSASAMVLLTNGVDSMSTYIDASGHFLLRGMDPGPYMLKILPRAEQPGMPSPEPITVENVTIVRGEIKEAGQFQF